jgi:P-type Mg2+ transporter
MLWKKMALPEAADVIAELESRPSGLLLHEVKERLRHYGENRIESRRTGLRDLVARRFKSSFLYLLLAAAGISFFLGERIEAFLIFVFILINASLETYQEYHSAKSLRLLERYLVSHVRVRRHGNVAEIESHEVVPGDIVLVKAGDRLTADVRFIESTALRIDESAMTGEIEPVGKESEALRFPRMAMHEAANIGFAGTVVVSGKGEGVVIATGEETALGAVTLMAEETKHETVFERSLGQFSRFILRLVVGTLLVIFLANVIIRNGETGVAELLVFSLALAVSVVPEALPVIVTVALSRGSLRLAQKKVVVKRLSAIEDLGSIEVLCTDKTGTITENALAVSEVRAKDKRRCLELAGIASIEPPLSRGLLHDPFDLAIWHTLSEAEKTAVAAIRRLDTLPFDPERRRNSVLFSRDKKYVVVVRGAFEEVLDLVAGLSVAERKKWIDWGKAQGKKGRRTLAVAERTLSRKRRLAPETERDLELVGFIAFEDPIKKSAAETIADARRLGIAVKILTGDSRDVAGAVAEQVGLVTDAETVITGAEFESLSPEAQRHVVETCHVFARVSPRQKYLIIQILQEKHEVGFLGEGINDAPALKLANVALVVKTSADIAKEAADVVILQHNLETVIAGVREGRIIFANILKYLRITLTSNFGNFYSVALASLFLPFVPLLPIQILLLNLLSDFPMIAVATDRVDHDELEKPRNYKVAPIIMMTAFFGFISSLFDFMLFAYFYQDGPAALQTAWFTLSVITEVVLIFSLRTRLPFFRAIRPSFALVSLSFLALVLVFILPATLFGQEIFHFASDNQPILAIVLVLALLYFVATEFAKRFFFSHFDLVKAK